MTSAKAPSLSDLSVPLKDRLEAFLVFFGHGSGYHGFDAETLQGVSLVSAQPETQTVRYTLAVRPELSNRNGHMHGGAITAIFDTLTTSALILVIKSGYWESLGVSRTLTVTFLRPVPVGSKVFIDCTIIGVGRKMASLQGRMTTEDGKTCATCVHDKAVAEGPRL